MDGFTSVTFTPPRSPPHSYKFNSTTALACDDSVSQKLFMSCIFLSPLMMLITLFGLSTFWEPNEDLCLLMARVSVLLVAVGWTRLDNVHKKYKSSLTRFLPPSPHLAWLISYWPRSSYPRDLETSHFVSHKTLTCSWLLSQTKATFLHHLQYCWSSTPWLSSLLWRPPVIGFKKSSWEELMQTPTHCWWSEKSVCGCLKMARVT